jgi:DNA-binding response OmpR family regulator
VTRILIVEDEIRIARLVRDYLHQAGFDVLEAVDGPSALSLARVEKPDMIVLDLGSRQGRLRRHPRVACDVIGTNHHAHRSQR